MCFDWHFLTFKRRSVQGDHDGVATGEVCFGWEFPTLKRAVCREHLRAAEEKAVEDQERAKKRFREWVRTKVPDAEYMNICSGPQVRPPATSYL